MNKTPRIAFLTAILLLSATAVFPTASVAIGQSALSTNGPHQLYNCPSGTSCSTNWSGFAVTGPSGSVSDVKGSWVVPAVKCTTKTAYSSYWVGIDGYNSNTVEQTGTDSDCSSGSAHYYAWYEFYPAPSVQISGFTVKPGDVIYAEVSYSTSTGQFTTTLTDGSQQATASSTVSGAARSSAEWIVERPSLCNGFHCKLTSLSNFGTVNLGNDFTTISGTNSATISGTSGAIGSFGSGVVRITMVNSAGSVLAEPSTLSTDGTSFSETWFASS